MLLVRQRQIDPKVEIPSPAMSLDLSDIPHIVNDRPEDPIDFFSI